MKRLFFLLGLTIIFFLQANSSFAQIGETTEFTDNVTIFGNLNVTGNKVTVSGIDVCLIDGTNCPPNANLTDTRWNITGSKYLFNNSGILEVNDTALNATITSVVNTETSYWEISVMLAIVMGVFGSFYNFSLLQEDNHEIQ